MNKLKELIHPKRSEMDPKEASGSAAHIPAHPTEAHGSGISTDPANPNSGTQYHGLEGTNREQGHHHTHQPGTTGTSTGTQGLAGNTTMSGAQSGLTREQRLENELDPTHHNRGAAGTDNYSNAPHSTSGALGAGVAGATAGSALTGHHHPEGTTGTTGRSFPLSGGATTGTSTNAGPHSSNLANKADPRVDSDLDGRRGLEGAGTSHTGTGSGILGAAGTTGLAGTGTTGRTNPVETFINVATHHEHHGHGHQFVGDPCESKGTHEHHTMVANALDPRINPGPTEHLASLGPTGITTLTQGAHDLPGSTGTTDGREHGYTGLGGSSTTGTTGVGHHDQHLGRDAGLAGAGLAGGAALAGHEHNRNIDPSQNQGNFTQRTVPNEYSHQAGSTATDPASSTVGPHKSNVMNVLDPRVLPDPAKQKDHSTSGPHTSDTLNRADPRYDSNQSGQHHYGRDAAVGAGALGAGGLAAHELGRDRQQPYDTTGTSGTHGIPGATGGYGTTNTPGSLPGSYGGKSGLADRTVDPSNQHHYGRDAAVGAGALGAGGLAAHELGRDRQQPYGTTGTTGTTGTHGGTTGLTDRTVDPTNQHHYGRDAALGAGAVGAGGVAAHELSRDGYLTQPYQTAGNAGAPGTIGSGGMSGTEAPRHQHGLFGQHNKDTDPAQATTGTHHHGRDAALGAGAGAAGYEGLKEHEKHRHSTDTTGTTGTEHEKKGGFLSGLLGHKEKATDPRAGHHTRIDEPAGTSRTPAAEAVRAGEVTPKEAFYNHPDRNMAGAGPVGATTAAVVGTGAAATTADAMHDRNRLHKDPPAGYYDRDNNPESAAVIDPVTGASGDRYNSQGGIVTEPHTGLPMNVGKYGTTGAGGTDNTQTIRAQGLEPGHHNHANWEDIGKKNTPY